MNFIRRLCGTVLDVSNHPLKRHARWRSAFEFCRIQTASRLVSSDVVVAFPNRTRLMVSPHMKGAAFFITPGLIEFEEMCLVMHFLRPEDCFIDVGANVGAYTVLASGVVGATSISAEPNPHVFRYLEDNVALNRLTSRVTAVNAALGRKEGQLRFTEKLGTENHVCSDSDHGPAITVPVTTLDKLVAGHAPVLVKIDVEGYETEVLAGASGLLKQPSLEAILIERLGTINRYGYDENALHQSIRDHSFIPCVYAPKTRTLTRIDDNATGNIVYVRDLALAQDRLRSGAPFEFAGFKI